MTIKRAEWHLFCHPEAKAEGSPPFFVIPRGVNPPRRCLEQSEGTHSDYRKKEGILRYRSEWQKSGWDSSVAYAPSDAVLSEAKEWQKRAEWHLFCHPEGFTVTLRLFICHPEAFYLSPWGFLFVTLRRKPKGLLLWFNIYDKICHALTLLCLHHDE